MAEYRVDAEARQRRLESWKQPICFRYPGFRVCGCTLPCAQAVPEARLHPVARHVVLGSLEGAINTPLLLGEGITHVVDVSDTDYTHLPPEVVDSVVYSLRDETDAPLGDVIPPALAYIDAVADAPSLADGSAPRVLVHCRAGVSRSVALVMAYLISRCGLSCDAALDRMRLVRGPRAEPNDGFMAYLRDLEPEGGDGDEDARGHSIRLLPDAILARILGMVLVGTPMGEVEGVATGLACVCPRFARLVRSNEVWRLPFKSHFKFGRLNTCPHPSGSWQSAFVSRMTSPPGGSSQSGAGLAQIMAMVAADITPSDVQIEHINDTPLASSIAVLNPTPPPKKPWEL